MGKNKEEIEARDITIADVFSKKSLIEHAGERSYGRGIEYFEEGRVKGLVEDHGCVNATVKGNRKYRVKLWIVGKSLQGSCTCPYGEEGNFCKHCVAVGLEWLENRNPLKEKGGKTPQQKTTLNDVESYLSQLPKDDLVVLLMEQVRRDELLRDRLILKTARSLSTGIDIGAYYVAIDNAFVIPDYEDDGESWDYGEVIDTVVDTIEELLKDGFAAEVINLTEHAFSRFDENMRCMEDFYGYTSDVQMRVRDIHLRACKKARPDPEKLAGKLFEWQMRIENGMFDGALEDYSPVLGKKGVAIYRKLAEEEWSKIPPLKPGKSDPVTMYSGKRHTITNIMESLAGITGNIEDLVAVKIRDLSNAYSFLGIAELYKNAGKPDMAFAWAEKGLKAFPRETDSRLRDFLVEEYHLRGRHDEEMGLVWADFLDRPSLGALEKLHHFATRDNTWSVWREKALHTLWEKAERELKSRKKTAWGWTNYTDRSLLVEIFLWEKDPETAWREAKEGGCSNTLWLRLANERAESQPEDAIEVYRLHIENRVQQKNNQSYEEAVQYIQKINKLMQGLGKDAEFLRYIAEVRAAHKPKRNFMKLLDQGKWV
ncbi:MAG: SWIM zinc finger family protein [Candidatus Latescibacter sp.]|nr:SWIM zinc finger family protein [Candidatus Latescibacter sp.]